MKLNYVTSKKLEVFPAEDGNVFLAVKEMKTSVDEVVVYEGIEAVADQAMEAYPNMHSLSLPASVKKLGDAIFSHYREGLIRVTYQGTSADFIEMAKPTVTTKYVPGPYDHYPYYSDYGASFSEEVRAFDRGVPNVEVYCEADDAYLYYGKEHKDPADPKPVTLEEKLAREAAAKRRMLALFDDAVKFMRESDAVTIAADYKSVPHLFPSFGTFGVYGERLYVAVPRDANIRPYIFQYTYQEVALIATGKDAWMTLQGQCFLVCEEEEIPLIAEALSITDNPGNYDYVYFQKVSLLWNRLKKET